MRLRQKGAFFITRRGMLLACYDALVFTLSYLLMILLNPSDSVNITAIDDKLYNFFILLACVMGLRIGGKVYNRVWRYNHSKSYIRLMLADAAAFVVYFFLSSLLSWLIVDFRRMSVICAMCVCMLSLLASMAMRYSYTWLYEHLYKQNVLKLPIRTIVWLLRSIGRIPLRKDFAEIARGNDGNVVPQRNRIRIAIIGAGRAGAMLAEELNANPGARYTPVCFVDVSKEKIGREVVGVKVVSENDDIKDFLLSMDVQAVVIAIQQTGKAYHELFDRYKQMGFKVMVYTFPLGNSRISGKRQIREFSIEELLFRKPVDFSSAETNAYYTNKVVLISGGGGSIGSELARQIARMRPKELVLLDIYENNVYDVQQELNIIYGENLKLSVEIASVRDIAQLDKVFRTYRPDIVLHAAAHKHVPLMEHNCSEAVKNNVFGTWNMVNAAEKYGVSKFIMVSTDKAVNPTNIMGASKRICEMIVLSRAAEQRKTSFSCTRFGNVLGSNGSVVPLFQRQIANGGPITLTDKRIIRYFMTIPEASYLVLISGAMAKSGELFVLDMGKPVRILDLAENMIRLSGLEPYKDIDIVEVGLRPGEKLYEELLIQTEKLRKTENSMIFIENDMPLSRAEIEEKLAILREALKTEDDDAIRKAMKAVVPTYHSPKHVNRDALADGRYENEARGLGRNVAG